MRRVLLGVLASAACAPKMAAIAADDPARLVATAQADDEIVATVDGEAIRASAIRDEMRASGKDARAALQALVDADVLARAALRRGLLGDPDVREAAQATEVRRLLHVVFEPSAPAERIPDSDYTRLYFANKLHFDHEEAIDAWHLLAPVPAGADAEVRAQARRRLEALLSQARAAASDEAFAALAQAPGAPALKAEHLSFPRHGLVDEAFADAAFALPPRAGATTGIVESAFGYHIIRIVRRMPAQHTTPTEARGELRDMALLAYRTRELDHWMRELLEHTHVETHPERLARTMDGGS